MIFTRRPSSVPPSGIIRNADFRRSSLPAAKVRRTGSSAIGHGQLLKRLSFVQNLFRLKRTSKSLYQRELVESSKHVIGSLLGPKLGDVIPLDGIGRDIAMTDGHRVTLRELVDITVDGIVLLMYPNVEAAGSDKYSNLLHECHQTLREMGYSVYGLSNDPPRRDRKYKLRHKAPFGLLYDEEQTLIDALGFKDPRKGTIHGVIAINKEGKVLVTMEGSADAVIESTCSQLSLLSGSDLSVLSST